MPRSLAEKKAEVMAKLEAIVDKALAEKAPGERLTIRGIEDIVLEARHEKSEQLTGVLVGEGSEQQVPGAGCPSCEQEKHYKGQKQR